MRGFFPGSSPKLSFSCGFSFTLISFSRGAFFESSHTCLVGSTGSEGFLILGFFFGTFFPCAYDFSLRASSGERSLGLSLDGPLGMLVIGGVICSLTFSLSCSATCPLGTIGYKGASSIFF